MPVLAKDAVIGVVYLTPKGRALERIARAVDADPEDDTVPFRRLDDGSTFGVAPDYLLTPKPVEVAPSRVDALKGQRIDDVIAAVVRSVEPYTGAPLTDDELEELLASDTRGRVQRAIAEEGARRAAGGRTLPGGVEAVLPAQPVPVEVKPAEVAPSGKDEWRDGVLVVAQGVVDVEGVPLIPDTSSDALPADVVAALTDEQTDAPFPPIEPNHEISAMSGSSAVSPAGGERELDDAVTAPTDDLPWPASTPAAAEPVAVHADGATTATEAPSAPVEAPAPADAPKPEKTRPRGWCPACRQHLTVRADGTMMQHFTPDGAKGPDGKRIDCQGVGLTPAAERPPEPRLPLPVAMGVEAPAAPIIERPVLVSPSTDPVIAEAVAAASAVLDAPPVAEPAPSIPRYVRAGGTSYGYTIVDLVPNEPMRREDGAVAVWEREEDADAALVYVREHGELPSDVVEEAPAGLSDSASICDHPAGYADGRCAACDADEPTPPRRWTASLDDRPVTTTKDATDNRPGNPIEALSRLVEEAKARGVRVRIVIEPIE